MTRTTRHSDRRHDNDVDESVVANNDNNNDNNSNTMTTTTTHHAKRTRRALHDHAAAADESASEFGAPLNTDADDVKLTDSTFAPGSPTGAAAVVGGGEEEVQLPQFIASLHELISDPATSHVVTWLHLPDVSC